MSDFKEIYDVFKAQSLEDWLKLNSQELGKQFSQKRAEIGNGGQVAENNFGSAGVFLKLIAKVAHAHPEDEFCEFLQSGELPPMKLSNEEMETLKGGWFGEARAGRHAASAPSMIGDGGGFLGKAFRFGERIGRGAVAGASHGLTGGGGAGADFKPISAFTGAIAGAWAGFGRSFG